MAVKPGGTVYFDGLLDEARVVTFNAADAGTGDINVLKALTIPSCPPRPLACWRRAGRSAPPAVNEYGHGWRASLAARMPRARHPGTSSLFTNTLPGFLDCPAAECPAGVLGDSPAGRILGNASKLPAIIPDSHEPDMNIITPSLAWTAIAVLLSCATPAPAQEPAGRPLAKLREEFLVEVRHLPPFQHRHLQWPGMGQRLRGSR